eukprot:SAG11_NODE_8969_length_958_cov_1.038417_1_plen_70_part_10
MCGGGHFESGKRRKRFFSLTELSFWSFAQACTLREIMFQNLKAIECANPGVLCKNHALSECDAMLDSLLS